VPLQHGVEIVVAHLQDHLRLALLHAGRQAVDEVRVASIARPVHRGASEASRHPDLAVQAAVDITNKYRSHSQSRTCLIPKP
jgi:hypothetical protein